MLAAGYQSGGTGNTNKHPCRTEQQTQIYFRKKSYESSTRCVKSETKLVWQTENVQVWMFANLRRQGIPDNRVDEVESAADCSAECGARPGCSFWTWNSAQISTFPNTCWLKSSDAGRKVEQPGQAVGQTGGAGAGGEGVRTAGLWPGPGRGYCGLFPGSAPHLASQC